jgi:hypothetical protein
MGLNCNEIKTRIDSISLNHASEEVVQEIRIHADQCQGCRAALTAATLSAQLLRVRIEEAEAMHPSPFFESLVMNVIKAGKVVSTPINAFTRWWEATSSILAFSASISVILIVVALMTTKTDDAPLASSTSSNLYPTEAVILDQNGGRDMTNEQVLQVVYTPRYEEKK